MRRRTVLGIGTAGLAAGLLPALRPRGEAAVGPALRRLSAAREEARLPDLVLRPELTEMARLQARHMAVAGATTHLAADGGDPVARARRAGYAGRVLGEALAETREGPDETVATWLAHDATRDVLLDPEARDLGLVMVRGRDGRAWWDLVTGA
jgi:uncharacterized protein YkwD